MEIKSKWNYIIEQFSHNRWYDVVPNILGSINIYSFLIRQENLHNL